MIVLMYCSYEGSALGYRMIGYDYRCGSAIGTDLFVPQAVNDFFDYDDFRMLWYGDTEEFFGARKLRVEASGRIFHVNFVVIENEHNGVIPQLADIVYHHLPDFAEVIAPLFSVGGTDGYTFDFDSFGKYLEDIKTTHMCRLIPSRGAPHIGLAVCISDWKKCYSLVTKKSPPLFKPRQFIIEEEYVKLRRSY